MAKNEFLPFGIADGANVLTNEEYGKLIARTNGFSSGVAKSQELNKVWRQASVIATVVAQFIAETNNQDVLDDGNLATLQKGLLSALRATVSSNIPNASLTTAGITKLSNATDSNAENIAATSKAVRQITDTLNTKQDKGDYATNSALNQVNDNANSRLEKAKNGADVEDKVAFVNNLGLAKTVELAKNAASSEYFSGDSKETLVLNKTAFFVINSDRSAGVRDRIDSHYLWAFNPEGVCHTDRCL
ncbi:phage tail protein [Xenorhabdus sp. KK7.4]|uniref:phage tail protein n=1 Tax=Xenorhabdus sp. KK7.4 TaxID=1851572 RepID=UPI000C05F784|nr:phage tail protein [Xenorhabdus sp. KK7.4]PHM55138.1 phage tail fiber protein [Xenorhabdus sp. KK7.4]